MASPAVAMPAWERTRNLTIAAWTGDCVPVCKDAARLDACHNVHGKPTSVTEAALDKGCVAGRQLLGGGTT
jgi:hypothetical protein